MQRWNEDRGNDEAEINGGEGGKGTYVQGMTILSGALLFEMPEVSVQEKKKKKYIYKLLLIIPTRTP